jgi:hypothetical protein
MSESDADPVAAYLDSVPTDRRPAIEAVRDVINANLPDGFEEGVEFGMLSWHVPLERYPDTYNGRPLGIVALANQKHHMAVYLMGVYGDEADAAWFRERWLATGRPLHMGKSCVRFRGLDDVALDVLGEAVARTSVDEFLRRYEASRATRR